MRTWTFAFLIVAGIVALLSVEASSSGLLVAARIGFAVLVMVALLGAVRTLVGPLARPWEHAAPCRRGPAPRRRFRSVRHLPDSALGTCGEHRHSAAANPTAHRVSPGNAR
jgi:hypothetical protein